MEQLFATFGIDWRLLVIQAVNFGILLAALSYFLYRPVMRIIDERRAKIAEGVRAANAARERLADAQNEADGIVGSAGRQAEEMIAAARARAGQRESELMRQAQEKSDALLSEAAARAQEEKRRVMQESQKEIARAAMLAAEKILREQNA